jgi:hypothetical protein
MKVIVEATPVLPRPSGVGLYVINLLAAQFSWRRTAQATLAAYRSLL